MTLSAVMNGITIGGTFPDGSPAPDTDGTVWNLIGLDGWESPDVVISTSTPIISGVSIGELKYGGRPITVAGSLFATSESLQHEARRKLMKAFDLVNRDGNLQVSGEVIAKQTTVRLAGRIKEKIRSAYFVEFEIPLLAPDPRKYNQTLTTRTVTIAGSAHTSTGDISQTGDTSTFPVITITGASDSPVISYSSKQIFINGTLGSSDTLIIDVKNRTVLKNGNNAYSLVGSNTVWPEISNGDISTSVTYSRTSNLSGSSTASFAYRDAWL